MTQPSSFRVRPFPLALFLSLFLVLFSACASTSPFVGVVTPVAGPTPPSSGPDVLGSTGEPGPVDNLEEALLCLAEGQPVYGVMASTAKVRQGPDLEACRIGRAPARSPVRIQAIFSQDGQLRVTANPLDQDQLPPLVGYQEDIQPIFQSACNSCHGETVQNLGLKVTEYEALMEGSENGPVIVPGDPENSLLWRQIRDNIMPLVGELDAVEKEKVRAWIQAGAPESRPSLPPAEELWFQLHPDTFNLVENQCPAQEASQSFVNGELVRLASCGLPPTEERIAQLLPAPEFQAAAPSGGEGQAGETGGGQTGSAALAAAPVRPAISPGRVGIQVAPLGLPAPSDADPWLIPQGGFCIEQRLQRLEGDFGITSLAFAPDGRLFLGLDSPSVGDIDPNIMFDAFHPSRSIGVYQSVSGDSFYTILQESSRVTGLDYANGALYVSRAGEVGRIVDGGGYERLAAGFPVNGRLFHANNGISVVDGWVYVSVGGVRDGYSDGLINPGTTDPPEETQAVNMAAGGNPYGARLVRASLDRLLSERNIGAFQTAARGFRNPYGLTSDPFGRLWITDNGATNVPGEYGAGDEVDLFDPRTLSPAARAGDENATPFYGFPLVLSGVVKEWYTPPVLELVNTAAPTGITWAYGTVFFAQYGRNPGLYRMANAGGRLVAERILLAWPIQAVTTAPDGAIWIGTGDGGVYRLAPGCN